MELKAGVSSTLEASLACPEIEARQRLVTARSAEDEKAVRRELAVLQRMLGMRAAGDGDVANAELWLTDQKSVSQTAAEAGRQLEEGVEVKKRALRSAIIRRDESSLKKAAKELRELLGEESATDADLLSADEWLRERERNREQAKRGEVAAEAERQRQRRAEEERKDREAAAQAEPAGTVRDRKTGLLWTKKDNGSGIGWKDAQSYCDNLALGGFTNWRMATAVELAELYSGSAKDDCGERHDCRIGLGIDLSGPYVWSSILGSKMVAWRRNFVRHNEDEEPLFSKRDNRVLCVRRSGA